MTDSHNLIKHLLRIVTPEEISEIATKHNGGKFLALTDLAYERFEKNILRDFASDETIVIEKRLEHQGAKILPFDQVQAKENLEKSQPEKPVHAENENMATFILIEKERLKKSQKSLKQKEIIDLYRKNSSVDVEQIKQTNLDTNKSDDVGILVNKKHF